MNDDKSVPDWADNILINKGLGFEIKGLKYLLWDYFNIQFSEMDCEQEMLINYFSCYVDESIKNGNVTKGIRFLESQREEERQEDQSRTQRPMYYQRPIRQSMLAEFEEKARNYLDSLEDDIEK